MRREKALLFAVGLSLCAARAAAASARDSPCHEEHRLTMGCTCTVRVCASPPAAARSAAAAALDELDRVDRLLSHYRADSPLSRLNREGASGPVEVPPELAELIALCLRWTRETKGAFDATVLPLMAAWGFLDGDGRVPSEAEREEAVTRVGAHHVFVDPIAGTVRFDRDGVALDLGGIGKGYAVDRAVAILERRGVGSALVNACGSSIYALGRPPSATAWSVALEDPARPGRTLESVRLSDRALSVSGRSARSFEHAGVVYSHVMDPRTGWPVRGVVGVAVQSPDATSGDALDNAVAVLGAVDSLSLLRRHGATATVYRSEPGTRSPRAVRLTP
jgi:thiamine biosynthesis lipoprotein